ncbi:MAG: hypothetical protein U1E20_05745 [Methylocystis sp.]|uniref:hypothetical protein n=1 Tax=Methylocystis sp. TaxID=1911079 RepID=UPI00393D12C5
MTAGPQGASDLSAGMPAQAGTPDDPIAKLNLTFRSLYGANREQVLAETPLAALTLIGTGEIWRVEHGELTKCYRPDQMLPKIKGLMHAVLGAHGAWSLSLRGWDSTAALQAARQLNDALGEALESASAELPVDLANPARDVLTELKRLSDGWLSGRHTTADEFPLALKRVNPQLERAIALVGQAVYGALRDGFEALRNESNPSDWARCYVGVCGPGQGRRDNIEIAAAMSVMGHEAVGIRLLYLENALTLADGLRFLAAALVERDLGQAVFNDQYRMWRDLLADAAIEHAGGGFFPQMGPG